jgi:hypothetical protein
MKNAIIGFCGKKLHTVALLFSQYGTVSSDILVEGFDVMWLSPGI